MEESKWDKVVEYVMMHDEPWWKITKGLLWIIILPYTIFCVLSDGMDDILVNW